ncbi:protein SSUH2 homolog [Scyliorhinus canicula]|uniref:protein SSUH2 homolog n=1 Tax=Scyliorhinus canicula TaxID=7830 RepID=UPI0018F30342|nr:protein SSUH2 homolog [Scyliorhinus canicula]
MDPSQSEADGPEDLEDEEGPTAPPIEMLDNVRGYEGTVAGGGGNYIPPPVYSSDKKERAQPQLEWRIPSITEEAAREALTQFADAHCCYSSSPARDMDFRDLTPFNMYRYRLETFIESRQTEWTHEPFSGQPVDSVACGYPPLPWDVVVQIPPMFQDSIKKVPVPHTAAVKRCHKCKGRGKYRCSHCGGKGKLKCLSCGSRGIVHGNKRCIQCGGRGMRRCGPCLGRGTRTCHICKTSGQLLFYIQLTVKWTNNVFEQVADQKIGLPVTLFSAVTGQNVFADESYLVYTIVGFPDPLIDQISQQGVQEHQEKFGRTAGILQQRQTIELIPVTKVYFQWKGQEHSYFVYGTENNVYAPDYPSKCHCAIL